MNTFIATQLKVDAIVRRDELFEEYYILSEAYDINCAGAWKNEIRTFKPRMSDALTICHVKDQIESIKNEIAAHDAAIKYCEKFDKPIEDYCPRISLGS